jgi:hypothetical protein
MPSSDDALIPKKPSPYPIFQMCLLVKDDSSSLQDRVFKLFHYSNDQQIELFEGLRATNLYRDDEAYETLTQFI